jgi:mannosyltransferase OCH1-like enzyme
MCVSKVNFEESIQYFYENKFNVEFFNYERWVLTKSLYEKEFYSDNKIPKKIHQVWLGSDLPEKYRDLCNSWQTTNPDWEYKLWTDKDIEEFDIDIQKFNQIKNLGTKSDILRYHILYKYGGIYADTDFLCLKSFDEFLKYDFFGCGGVTDNNNNPLLFNGLFGASKNNEIVGECIKHISDKIYESTNFEVIMNLTGPYYLTEMFFKNVNIESNVIMLPLSFCYPLPAVHRHSNYNLNSWIREESICVHLWEQSWQK